MKKIGIFILCITVFASCASTEQATAGSKKEVPGVQGTLTLHPDSIAYKGKDAGLYYFFYDFAGKSIFISRNEELYWKFSSYLPDVIIPGRSVKLEGPTIDPFTLFTKDQLEEETNRLGIELNQYRVVKIFNYGLIGSGQEIRQQLQNKTINPQQKVDPLDKYYKKKN